MELQILISKKGTKVVSATNLYAVLELPAHHYGTNVKRWLNDVYEFSDGIRKPVKMRDFAYRKSGGNPVLKDYYFTVELAKLITLNSKSKVKQKYANRLLSLEDKVESAELLSKDQVMTVLELAKAMSLVSCQLASERNHLETYEKRNKNSAANWWKYRSSILGYSSNKLRNKMKTIGEKISGKSQRQMLMRLDKHELVRTGIIDLFMAMGKTERYAKNLGDLAKIFARELRLDIVDDRKSPSLFNNNVNPGLLNEIRGSKKGNFLGLW